MTADDYGKMAEMKWAVLIMWSFQILGIELSGMDPA